MAYPKGGTYNIPAGAGDVIDVGGPVKSLRLTIDDGSASTAACYVRCGTDQTSAPSAPVGSPAPSDGDLSAAGWQQLKGPGSSYAPPLLEFSSYRYIEIWGLADGMLSVTT